MKNESVRLTVSYSVVQFFFWFTYGTTLAYASPYLLSRGLNNTMIGFISAAACFCSVLLQPVLAAYADREHSLSVKTILMLVAGGMIGFGVLLRIAYGRGAVPNAVLLGAAILLIQLGLPFSNALATETINQGKDLQYSLARGVGSIGYAVMSVALGQLIARFGTVVECYALIGTSACFLLSIALFPFKKSKRRAPGAQEASGSALAFFRRYPTFTVTLAGCVLIYISHVCINNFVYQIVVPRGGGSQHMGTAMALAGLLEVVSMFFFARLLKWKSADFWFRISGVFFTLKTFCTLLAPSMGVFYLVQLFQPLGWGLLIVSSVYYVNGIMQEQDRIKGQAFMTMTLSVATILGSIGGGFLIDALGVDGMLVFATVCGAVGTVIVMSGKKRMAHP